MARYQLQVLSLRHMFEAAKNVVHYDYNLCMSFKWCMGQMTGAHFSESFSMKMAMFFTPIESVALWSS